MGGVGGRLVGCEGLAVGGGPDGLVVHAGLDGGVVPFSQGEHSGFHADERVVLRGLLELRGKPRAHRHFGALADVTQEVFLDGEVGDLFVVKRPADEAEHFRRGFGKSHAWIFRGTVMSRPVALAFALSRRGGTFWPHSTGGAPGEAGSLPHRRHPSASDERSSTRVGLGQHLASCIPPSSSRRSKLLPHG